MVKLHKNEAGFGAVEGVLALVIVALIGVVGVMAYNNHNKATTTTNNVKTATPATKAKTPTVDPYADWQAYTDTAKLFSVKYPADWTATNPELHVDTPYALADKNQSIFSAPNPSQANSPTEINAIAFSSSDTQGVLTKGSFGDKQTTPQSMTINGYKVIYSQDIEDGATGTTPTYTVDQYAVTNNGVTLLLTFREQQGNDSYVGTAKASGAFDHTSAVPNFTALVKSVKFLN